uniref:Uncharacterized protein n=1 Tax=Anguilla anguilla TaxID=7936 RepID=A0A0E9XN82_ANGAN
MVIFHCSECLNSLVILGSHYPQIMLCVYIFLYFI